MSYPFERFLGNVAPVSAPRFTSQQTDPFCVSLVTGSAALIASAVGRDQKTDAFVGYGLWLTCAHVVDVTAGGLLYLSMGGRGGSAPRLTPGFVVGYDAKNDVAAFVSKHVYAADLGAPFECRQFDDKFENTGVYAVGWGAPQKDNRLEALGGIVFPRSYSESIGLVAKRSPGRFGISCQTRKGDSGGPIIDKTGALIGIISQGLKIVPFPEIEFKTTIAVGTSPAPKFVDSAKTKFNELVQNKIKR